MDRRSFITWITTAGATLSLPEAIRPTMKWKPAEEFWVSHRFDWIRCPSSDLYYRESKEMFVPVDSPQVRFLNDNAPNFGYGTPWEKRWVRDITPNFSLGHGMPDAALQVEAERFYGKDLINDIPAGATTSPLDRLGDAIFPL